MGTTTTPAPSITIKNKKYTMPKPKIKLWRHLIKFSESQASGELDGEKVLDEIIDIVAIAFNNAEITKEVIEENIDFEELGNVFSFISQEVTNMVNGKMMQFPNVLRPAGK